ncbi:MAG: DNA polymerase III subunit delta [Treponema sp.]|nr:DNA polymerase III subunit delta [Treponema sp.]
MACAYIFLGPELGKKQEALDAVRKKLVNAEETVFYAGETPAGAIIDTIFNDSLFADSRLVIVKNAEQIKNEKEIERLVSCIKKAEEGTAVVLLSDEIKLASGFDDAVPKENRQVFYELFEREKKEWLRTFFKQKGFNIDLSGIDTILEMVENNTEALGRECSRLICFLPKDKPVTAVDIEKWLSHNREESVFTLFSHIAAGNLSKALESLHAMLAANERADNILAGLARSFRKLGDYLALLEKGETNFYELKKIGLSSPKARDDYAAAGRRYNIAAADACLALTADYDILLRSPAAALGDILMDRYILAIFAAEKLPSPA